MSHRQLSGKKSTQHIYGLVCNGRFPRRYMTDQGRALKEQYQWEARAQWDDKPLKGEMRMHVTLYFGRKRKLIGIISTSRAATRSTASPTRTTARYGR